MVAVSHEIPMTDFTLGKDKWEPSKRKPEYAHHIKNKSKERWEDIFHLKHSVVPKVIIPCISLSVWSAIVCSFYLIGDVQFLRTLLLPNSTLLLSLLGTTVSLLLAFRVNTAYDRFWEGRKLYSTLHLNIRQIGRLIAIYVKPQNQLDQVRKVAALNLLIGFSSAVKHELRSEFGARYSDLGPYFQQLETVAPKVFDKNSHLKVSLQILRGLQAYVLDISSIMSSCTGAINTLNECYCSLERIRFTPVPAAYTIHLHQALVVYMVGFPFQLVASPLGWFTIPVVAIISFVVLGVENIAQDIENPFGFDPNDLPQDVYVDTIIEEITEILKRCEDPHTNTRGWIVPYSLDVNDVDTKKLMLKDRK
ncbi:UNVERIFIED_CONTAM: hypothetical protein HDU68_010050 [Siphonaria sp. JEL0065]|nr:hypothetical protein HDU68_010050 [Siphonaria sp. JEL0065]